MLTEDQANQIKEQLLKQLGNFPEDKREQIKEQVMSMSAKEFEEFLRQNNLLSNSENPQSPQQCIFCLINEGKIKSYKIDEDRENLAILEINPLSKAHSLVIPRKHLPIDELPSSTFELAKKISKKIKERFKPKEIKLSPTNMLGHALIEIIPLYGDEKQRKKASEDELKKLQEELIEKPEQEKPKEEPEKPKEIPKLKPRIP